MIRCRFCDRIMRSVYEDTDSILAICDTPGCQNNPRTNYNKQEEDKGFVRLTDLYPQGPEVSRDIGDNVFLLRFCDRIMHMGFAMEPQHWEDAHAPILPTSRAMEEATRAIERRIEADTINCIAGERFIDPPTCEQCDPEVVEDAHDDLVDALEHALVTPRQEEMRERETESRRLQPMHFFSWSLSAPAIRMHNGSRICIMDSQYDPSPVRGHSARVIMDDEDEEDDDDG